MLYKVVHVKGDSRTVIAVCKRLNAPPNAKPCRCVPCSNVTLKKHEVTEENFTFDLIKSKNMSKASKQPTQKVEINESAKTDEGKAKVFVKSDWPKTPKETIKLVVNTFLNFFG